MLAGDIPLGHESVNVSLPLYREKKMKIIALTGTSGSGLRPKSRSSQRPSPASTSASGRAWSRRPARRSRSSKGCMPDEKGDGDAEVRDRFIAAGIEPAGQRQPGSIRSLHRAQADTRSQVIKAVGMKIE